MFDNLYKGKKVFVTGHTGFKGSWLCAWLLQLGAKVCGFSIDIPTNPSNFEILDLKNRIQHIEGDVYNRTQLLHAVREFQPDIIFHLAAQSLVRRSYNDPITTFETNALGTMNVLECIRQCSFVHVGVIITSDKCYRNVEWTWGYRENDILGGEDPYSASKGCAELIVYSYVKSFFQNGPRVASARAGNVIGGGDWAPDRIVPDCVRAWSKSEKPIIRNPEATRPWQHVLEPLSGYLWLGVNLIKKSENTAGEAFNFGPNSEVVKSVRELVDLFLKFWGEGSWRYVPENRKKESTFLKLSCDKARSYLKWHSVLSFEETVKLTAEWYKNYYNNNRDIYEFSCSQINYYVKKAIEQSLPWTRRRM